MVKYQITISIFLAALLSYLFNRAEFIDVIGVTILTFIFENIIHYFKNKKS